MLGVTKDSYITRIKSTMPDLDDDLNTASLPTIAEEDDSTHSGSTNTAKDVGNKQNGDGATAAKEGGKTDEERKEEKRRGKKEKKKKHKEHAAYTEDHDTAHQILVDLCNEMKALKASMKEDQEMTNTTMVGNLESNQLVMKSLTDQMEAMQGNIKQLDQVIESKATPEQIEELARIRAVQEMIRVATEDKERTVKIYETHARRGYEEIDRLRQDLESERKEVAALRTELEIIREERQWIMTNGVRSPPKGSFTGLEGLMIDDSSSKGGSRKGPGGLHLNSVKRMSDFDDMTLETKGSYDTTAYEMKSLKKRIIHMKKKLTVAQQEAKETDNLRAEVERLRIECETEKKASLAKDETIKRLKKEVEDLRRSQANAEAATAAAATAKATASSPIVTPPTHTRAPRRKSPPSLSSSVTNTSAKSVTVSTPKKKWWQNL